MNKNSNIIENSAVKNHRTKSCYAPEIWCFIYYLSKSISICFL